VREPERAAVRLDRRPADARDAPLAQPHGAAGDEPEPGNAAVLLGLLERELQAEADPERRPPEPRALAERLVEPARAQPRHRARRRAHARQDGDLGLEERGRFLDELRARPEPRERELHRAHVPGAVRRDRDRHSSPFVDGIPAPSRATAARSARPTALNAASAT
jgi:hypothetical protein